ncbi:MAG TPA: hypothetical protein DCL44_03310 [Elusimicrobia bacterium]|nr:hypothetical protein [Elusimicrobiota bacterium]
METIFSEALIDFRKAAGFPTAYRFYHDNGGKPVLTFSYRKYLLFEQGEALPSPEELRRISLALRFISKSPAAGKLAATWLKTMAGEEPYSFVFEPFISVKTETPGLSPMHKVMDKLMKRLPITVEQAVVILSSYGHYLSYIVLVNGSEAWSCEALSKTAGLKKPAAAKILADFAKAGLVKRIRNDSFKSFGENAILEFPRAEIMPHGLNDKLRGYQAEMIASGAITWRRMTVLRADAVELAAFYQLISLTMSSVSAYETCEKTRNSAMFGIESRVVKLFDF